MVQLIRFDFDYGDMLRSLRFKAVVIFLIVGLCVWSSFIAVKNSPSQVSTKIMADSTTCAKSQSDIIELIRSAAERLEGTHYNTSNGTDCSGMFHKVTASLRDSCPSLVFPEFKTSRSSRDIALWYFKRGKLNLIKNPEHQGELIQPGMVMFYRYGISQAGKIDRSTMTMETLRQRGTGINHVAIVTDVKLVDEKVFSYEVFHGLNLRKPATTSTLYFKQERHPAHGYYSHWDEPWVAVAYISGGKN